MHKSYVWIALLVIAVVGVLALANSGFFGGGDVGHQVDLTASPEADEAKLVSPKSLSEALGVPEDEMIEVGGIERPKRDVAFNETPVVAVPSTKSAFPFPGTAPAVDSNANEQVAGLFNELSGEGGGPPEARSSLFAPEPFDQAKYEADPQAWLDLIRPGRAFQPAQPSPDVKPIATKTKPFHNILQGEKVILDVQADPGAPVTFYTPQVGEFENRLTTQSVAANENGIATATYTATPGTLGIIDVIAASPVHSEQLKFRIRVSLPDD